jgi:hypothetical protein
MEERYAILRNDGVEASEFTVEEVLAPKKYTKNEVKADFGSFFELRDGDGSNWRSYGILEIQRIPKISPHFDFSSVIAPLSRPGVSFSLLIRSHANAISLYLVLVSLANDGNGERQLRDLLGSVSTVLYSAFPMIQTRVSTIDCLQEIASESSQIGLLTGTHSSKPDKEEGISHLDRLLRGMFGEEGWFLAVAEPISTIRTSEITRDLTREIMEVARSKPDETKASLLDSRYIALLESELRRIDLGKSTGLWQTCCFFGSSTDASFEKLRALVASVYSDSERVSEPTRTLTFQPNAILRRIIGSSSLAACFPRWKLENRGPELFGTPRLSTTLTSAELTHIVRLPREEMPGYTIVPTVKFSVNYPQNKRANIESEVNLGEILDYGAPTGNSFLVINDDLCKHMMIAGLTGTGKTVDAKNIAFSLSRANPSIPWTIIEPVKAEYRALARLLPEGTVRVFTLGEEETAPFRFNPFAVPPGAQIMRHIGLLKSVILACFGNLWDPLPEIMERGLYNLYTKRGWNLALNKRGETPNMFDYYWETLDVAAKLDYPVDTRKEVRQALGIRLGSLLMGAKGRMFGGHIPIDILLNGPTILELRSIDDEEKGLVMGFLFSAIFEFMENQGPSQELRHFLFVDEAHRVFSRLEAIEENREGGHSRARAVNALSNMIAEARAYGLGIGIIDQTPTKLAPDAVRNTNLKICHRLVASSEGESMGDTMGLSTRQRKYLVHLGVGDAVVSMEGLQGPFLIHARRTPNEPANVSDQELFEMAKGFQERHRDAFSEHENWEYMLAVEPLLRKDLSDSVYALLEHHSEPGTIPSLCRLLLPATETLGYPAEDQVDLATSMLRLFLRKMRYNGPDESKFVERFVESFVSECNKLKSQPLVPEEREKSQK